MTKPKNMTPEQIEKEKALRRSWYERNKEAVKARAKEARSTPEGKQRRNQLEQQRRKNESEQQRQKRIAVSNSAREKRVSTNSEIAEKYAKVARNKMRELRKDQGYREKNQIYQKNWARVRRSKIALDREYEAFLTRAELEGAAE